MGAVAPDINAGGRRAAISFVTVVYAGEVGLLRLQARSLARYFPVQELHEILVIANDRDPVRFAATLRTLALDYGPHADKLRFVLPDDIVHGPRGPRDWGKAAKLFAKGLSRRLRNHPQRNWRGASGWLIQQAMKLAACRAVTCENMVYLDAKNHFIAHASAADFFDETGTPRARLEQVQDNYFEWHQSARAYFDDAPLPRDAALPPSITPFACNRQHVLQTLDLIEGKSSAIEFFFTPKTPLGTEFTLIFAHMMRAGPPLNADRSTHSPVTTGLIPFASIFRDATQTDIAQMISQAQSGAVRMLGTHSGRLAQMSLSDLNPLLDLWHRRGLTSSTTEGAALLARAPAQ
jgi:hypothetical protein